MFRSRCIIGLIALAVTIRALVPAGFMLSSTSFGNGVMTVVICTSSGLKLMHLDSDGKPAAPTEHAMADAPCTYGPPTIVVTDFEPVNVAIERRTIKIAHDQFVAFTSTHRHRPFRLAREPPSAS